MNASPTHAHPLEYPAPDLPPAGTAQPVAPGVRWIRMPLPYALDHINLWLLDDGDDVVAVDSGFALDEVRQHWRDILGADRRRLSGVVVTHCHPDHIGLASWLAERDAAPVYMTQGEYLGAHALWHQLPGYSITDMVEQFHRHGLEPARLDALRERGNAYRRGAPALPTHFHRMFAGDLLHIGGQEWRVIVGYGHSPEHASLYCETNRVLISGDMLLPRISTNVSVYAATPEDDPLTWFLESLQRLRNLPEDTLVLPSHGKPFRGLRKRVEQLEAHHEERCDALLGAMQAPRSAAELLPTLFPRELDTHQVMFAMGEAVAHLNYLVNRRRIVRRIDREGLIRFERVA